MVCGGSTRVESGRKLGVCLEVQLCGLGACMAPMLLRAELDALRAVSAEARRAFSRSGATLEVLGGNPEEGPMGS